MYEIYCKLRNKKGLKDSDVARISGITKSTFSDWKNGRSNPKNDKLQKIADCLGVTIDYLITGNEENAKKESELNSRDKRDIAKDLDRIIEEISNQEDGPLFYNGQPLEEDDMKFLAKAIEVALIDAKKKNKVTYNPYKNKPKSD